MILLNQRQQVVPSGIASSGKPWSRGFLQTPICSALNAVGHIPTVYITSKLHGCRSPVQLVQKATHRRTAAAPEVKARRCPLTRPQSPGSPAHQLRSRADCIGHGIITEEAYSPNRAEYASTAMFQRSQHTGGTVRSCISKQPCSYSAAADASVESELSGSNVLFRRTYPRHHTQLQQQAAGEP